MLSAFARTGITSIRRTGALCTVIFNLKTEYLLLCSVCLSGATNVGSVQIYMDEKLKTNQWVGLEVGTHRCKEYDELVLPSDAFLGKGELLGQFNMGSTIVLIFEAPRDFK